MARAETGFAVDVQSVEPPYDAKAAWNKSVLWGVLIVERTREENHDDHTDCRGPGHLPGTAQEFKTLVNELVRRPADSVPKAY